METQRKQIFVVEDDADIIKSIKEGLEFHGYEMIGSAVSGEQALSMLEKITPDLILMDIQLMGDMDGVDTAKYVISKFKIPVVYLTGLTDNKIIEKAKLTEPYGYLVKPFDLSELKATIEIALYKHVNELKKEKTFSMLQDSVAKVLWDVTSKMSSKPMKAGQIT